MGFLFKWESSSKETNNKIQYSCVGVNNVIFHGKSHLHDIDVALTKQIMFCLSESPLSKILFYARYKKLFVKLFTALPYDHKYQKLLKKKLTTQSYMNFVERNIENCKSEEWFQKKITEMEENERESILYFIENIVRFKSSKCVPSYEDLVQLKNEFFDSSYFVVNDEKKRLFFFLFDLFKLKLNPRGYFTFGRNLEVILNVIEVESFRKQIKTQIKSLLDEAPLKKSFFLFLLIDSTVDTKVKPSENKVMESTLSYSSDTIRKEIEKIFKEGDERLFKIRFMEHNDRTIVSDICEDMKTAIKKYSFLS